MLLNSSNIVPAYDASRPSRKLAAKYVGPYKVLEAVGGRAFRLELRPGDRFHDVVHVSWLLPFRQDRYHETPQPQPVQVEDHEEWTIVRLLKHQWRYGSAISSIWSTGVAFRSMIPPGSHGGS